MRNKLIELCRNAAISSGIPSVDMPLIADHLLAEGVIVLPCKVGDKLYAINASQTRVHPYIVTHLEAYESGVKIFGRPIYSQQEYWMCWAEELGDRNGCVFLTREEAEQALKEAQDDKQ